MTNLTTIRRRKSEVLTSDEKKALQKFISSHHTMVDAAETLGIPRNTLDRVKLTGSGSPETIQAIREKLV
jgi:sugar diacid utilization regulator